MAHTIRIKKLMDGPSHVTLWVYIHGDGISPELKNQLILNPTQNVVPPMPARQDFIIKQIWYETGFEIVLEFGRLDAPNQPVWALTPSTSLHHDWRFFGGLRDWTDADNFGLDATGQILISTLGLGQTSQRATMVLHLEKRDRPNPQLD